jgi:hypothetical protein
LATGLEHLQADDPAGFERHIAGTAVKTVGCIPADGESGFIVFQQAELQPAVLLQPALVDVLDDGVARFRRQELPALAQCQERLDIALLEGTLAMALHQHVPEGGVLGQLADDIGAHEVREQVLLERFRLVVQHGTPCAMQERDLVLVVLVVHVFARPKVMAGGRMTNNVSVKMYYVK